MSFISSCFKCCFPSYQEPRFHLLEEQSFEAQEIGLEETQEPSFQQISLEEQVINGYESEIRNADRLTKQIGRRGLISEVFEIYKEAIDFELNKRSFKVPLSKKNPPETQLENISLSELSDRELVNVAIRVVEIYEQKLAEYGKRPNSLDGMSTYQDIKYSLQPMQAEDNIEGLLEIVLRSPSPLD